MESPPCEASSEASNPSLCGLVQLPPKKRASEREKAVICESSEAQNDLPTSDMNNVSEISSSPLGCIDEETTPQNDPQEKASFDDQTQPLIASATPEIIILPKKEEQQPSPLAPPPPSSSRQQPAAVCKFCGQQFSTTQALGGHQNAHKHEREIQRAMKAAHEFATNPFIVGTTRPPPLFHASHYGPQIRYSPYHGLARRGWPHPRMSLSQGPPGFARTLDGFIRPSLRWPRPTYVQASGPAIRSFMRTTASNSIAPPNSMNPMQVRGNHEHNLGMKQCVESTDLSLSLTSSETEEHNLPPKQNISSEPDLTLKL